MSPGCDPSPAGPARKRVPFGVGLLLTVGPHSAPEVGLEGDDDDGDNVFAGSKTQAALRQGRLFVWEGKRSDPVWGLCPQAALF